MIQSQSLFYRSIKLFYPFALLLLLSILGYWQVALLQYPLKWDLIDQAYPWKYLIGECLQNQLLPLWNPYQHCGYPIHADPQSSAWYPVVWIIGYFWGYNIYTLSLDFVLHIFLAGVGMFLLGKKLGFSRSVSLLMGIGYMFSGFFVGNAQHFMWIISGTWLPFIIGAYIDLYNKRKTRQAVIFSLFIFMIVTGGYPAFTMILLYLLFILFIFFSVEILKLESRRSYLKFIRLNAIAVVLSILNTSVMLASIYKLLPYILRAKGVHLVQALFGPLSPKSLISFLLPFGSINHDMSAFDTDLSMTNIYFGIVLTVFFILGLFIKKPIIIKIFLYWGIFMLTAAVGKYLPVREFLYHYLPFFKSFRFPSLLRIFVLISFIIISGFALNSYFENKIRTTKLLRYSIAGIVIMLITIVAINIHGKFLHLGGYISGGGIFTFSKTSTLPQQIFFQGIIQFIFLLILSFLLFKIKNKIKLFKLLILVSAIDLLLALQLNAPYSVYYEQNTQKSVFEFTNQLPKDFPLPSNKQITENYDRSSLSFGPLWKNLNIFHKQIAYDGSNPLKLKNYEYLNDSLPDLLLATIRNQPVFFAKNIIVNDSIKNYLKENAFTPDNVFLHRDDFNKVKLHDQNQGKGDSVWFLNFSPTKIIFKTHCYSNRLLTFIQNNYYGWEASINDKKVPVYTANLSFMAVVAPAGIHMVTLEYKPKLIIAGFYVSLISLTISLLVLIIQTIRKYSHFFLNQKSN